MQIPLLLAYEWCGKRGPLPASAESVVKSHTKYVSRFARLLEEGKALPPASSKTVRRRTRIAAGAPRALIFSPHPDDECIVAALALRLLREAQWNVLNVAVTLGSKRQRRAARLRELKNACGYLGFGLIVAGGGLEKINLAARRPNSRQWAGAVKVVSDILKQNQPRVIFVPHKYDGHETHIGTHLLVVDALRKMPLSFECHVVETEFWRQMAMPNLLVEVSVDDLADLVAALSFHVGEVKRNPYHLRLPAWMMDNVRRAEVVGGHGTVAPDFTFATIYRLRKWKQGRMVNVLKRGKFLSCAQNPDLLFA